MFRFFLIIILFSFIPIFAQLRVVTSTTDLKYIAEQIGKDKVKVDALIQGKDDPHYMSARPDFLIKLNKADVYCEIGLDLEVGWSYNVLVQSRNSKIQKGQSGYCNTSDGIKILEKPKGNVDKSMGHIHAFGNPHYWTDPMNAIKIGQNIKNTFIKVDPNHSDFYTKNFESFQAETISHLKKELKSFEPYFGSKVAVFHSEYIYFAKRFKLNIAANLEETPGVPPSNRYLERVIQKMKKENIKVILIAPFNNSKYADFVASKVPNAKVVIMPISIGSTEDAKTYNNTIHQMVSKLKTALSD